MRWWSSEAEEVHTMSRHGIRVDMPDISLNSLYCDSICMSCLVTVRPGGYSADVEGREKLDK